MFFAAGMTVDHNFIAFRLIDFFNFGTEKAAVELAGNGTCDDSIKTHDKNSFGNSLCFHRERLYNSNVTTNGSKKVDPIGWYQ